MKTNKMFPKVVDCLTFLNRLNYLEDIIFELKETLKYYADKETYAYYFIGVDVWENGIENDKGKKAREILKKYNKSWNKIYEEAEKRFEKT